MGRPKKTDKPVVDLVPKDDFAPPCRTGDGLQPKLIHKATGKDLGESPPSAPDPAFLRDLFKIDTRKTSSPLAPRYKNAQELSYLIGEYFATKVRPVIDEDGYFIGYKWIQKISISGLANWLHMTTERLRRIQRNDEYGDILTMAKQIVEEYNEQTLLDNRNPGGIIFILKNNFGWKDAQDVVISQKDPFADLSNPDEIRNRLMNSLGVIDITPEDS
jgi:hypothetical protein